MNSIERLLSLFLLAATAGSVSAAHDTCDATAQLQKRSNDFELREELYSNIGLCLNLTDPGDRADCFIESILEFGEGVVLAQDRLEARLDLCELLGGGAYDPEIDPDDFSPVIDNPYLPFPVGAQWIYESETEDGLETIEVTVLEVTREILGVECLSVRDVVSIDGEPIEDTIDWYAQDDDGNVWYFGEISFSFEDGYVASIDGSWLAGVDGAKPGIVMLADREVGTTYRQEWLIGEAEDAATVLATDVTVEIEFGVFRHCLQTADFLPPEPDALEHKFYAPRIGLIFETKPGEDETVELVSHSGLDTTP